MNKNREMRNTSFVSLLLMIFGVSASAQQNVPDSLTHQNGQRLYIVHLPPGYNSSQSEPVVIVLHGGSGNYQSVQGFTQMNLVSNQNGFLAVYPQGQGIAPPGYSWADGRNTSADQAGIDDVGFISKLIDSLYADYNIDTNRIYICGFSNGGFMTQRLACERPHRFAAIGALGCSMDTNLIKSCLPNKAVPTVYFSGTADPEVPYRGGAMNNPAVTPIVPVDTALHYWVDNNNCQTADPVVNLPNVVLEDSSRVERYRFSDCDCQADVLLFKIINGGHTWPGVPIGQFPQLGNTNEDIHASYLLWDFFRQFTFCKEEVGVAEERNDGGFYLYPNPTKGKVDYRSEERIKQLILLDKMGRKETIELRDDALIDISDLRPGLYFIRIEFVSGAIQTTKVLKQ